MARIWDDFLTERDKAVFGASGYGAGVKLGARPALMVIDAGTAIGPVYGAEEAVGVEPSVV